MKSQISPCIEYMAHRTILYFVSPAVHYQGVENYGVEDNVAYLSADLYLMGISFNLCEMREISMCDDTMVADEANENDCPGDGSFEYGITYRLPSAGPEVASWLATGWKGNGILQMFAAQDESMMIGNCELDLKTFVTQQGETLIGAPSAAVSAGIALGALATLSLLCCYCYCCRRRRKTKTLQNKQQQANDDHESYFQRMEEERSYWSGKSKKSKKTQATSRDSVVSDL